MLNEAEILEMTYFDLCTIKRKQKNKNLITGITENVDVTISENIKCALSKGNRTNLMSVDGVGNIIEPYMIFINPNVDLQAGDTVIVNGLNGEQTFIANKPFTHISHTKCNLTFTERV